jgi:regulator of protease activity HflC (stomatin/prohibitin superfamily)
MIRETLTQSPSGLGTLILLILLITVTVLAIPLAVKNLDQPARGWVVAALVLLVTIEAIGLGGCFTVEPNQGVVLTLFGNYKGTEKAPGLRWANPFYSKMKVSLRARNFETAKLKVNDHDGNPIEIGAVVVWQVIDTAEAVFEVDNYENYVHVQSEAALRNLATSYPYDAHEDGQTSLRGATAEVAAHLKREVEDRLSKAGVQVTEARISHLAYAPEIAQAMLQRQQASAIIAARQKIVEGAVGMVEMALEMLNAKGVVTLDEERKAAMVSNLLVVLCSERASQPVVNTGSLYQ